MRASNERATTSCRAVYRHAVSKRAVKILTAIIAH